MERRSNFEAYRIVCILLIVIMHTFGAGTGQVNTQLGIFINTVGNIGVTGFVLLSGYFGIRLKGKKLAKMDLMLIFWSLASFAVRIFIGGLDTVFSMKALLTCFIPVISHKYWFISAYFCLCILSPFINEYLEYVGQKRHKQLIIAAGVLFLLLPTVCFFDQTGDGGKGIVNMILAYVIGRYIGIYHKDRVMPRGRIAALLAGVVIVNFALNDAMYLAVGNTANYFANVIAVYVLEDTVKICLHFAWTMYAEQGFYILIVLAVSLTVFAAAVLLEEIRKRIFGKIENVVIDKAGNKVAKWIK